MIGTITPLVKVAPKEWKPVAVLFVVSGTASAAILGAIIGTLGGAVWRALPWPASDAARHIGLLGMLGFAITYEMGWWPVDLPQAHRSVPRRWWLTSDHRIAGLLYGAIIGLGVTTHMRFASLYVVLTWIFLFGTPVSGIAVLAAYGASRSLTVVATSVPVRRAQRPASAVDGLRSSILTRVPALHMLNAGVLVLILLVVVGSFHGG